jgi:hypothetical protein
MNVDVDVDRLLVHRHVCTMGLDNSSLLGCNLSGNWLFGLHHAVRMSA